MAQKNDNTKSIVALDDNEKSKIQEAKIAWRKIWEKTPIRVERSILEGKKKEATVRF